MNVLQVLHLTKTVVSACGLARLLTAVALLFPSASMESLESRAVPWEKCSMQEQDLVRMGSVQTQSLCQNAQTTTLVVTMWN